MEVDVFVLPVFVFVSVSVFALRAGTLRDTVGARKCVSVCRLLGGGRGRRHTWDWALRYD